MLRMLAMMILAGGAVCNTVTAADLPVVEVDRDNFEIRQSARVVITQGVIADDDGNGVIHIIGDDLVVDFSDAHLRGAGAELDPDGYTGIGVRITGSNNTIRGGRFSGFKVAVHAVEANGLTIEDVDVSDNFRQRLLSTPETPSEEDVLNRYENDNGQWLERYGAGVAVERSENVTIRGVRARDVQNGILLDRVNNSRAYDNDCSFLSGWGLAMWRASHNTISRNAFNFCVRGYSHGVYHGGHGAAGILMVEQCSHNIITENSLTHGGAGIHVFAGPEALGMTNPREEIGWYEGRGSNANLIIDSDLSYAASHGVEALFGFNNLIVRNRIASNAISGISADFSHSTLISFNDIEENGGTPHGDHGGGVNIAHGSASRIQENVFRRNPVAVRLWAQADHPALELPWAGINHKGSTDNAIVFNDFTQDGMVTELEDTTDTRYGRHLYTAVREYLVGDEVSMGSIRRGGTEPRVARDQWNDVPVHGTSAPVSGRDFLQGRDRIVVTEWGPLDWTRQPVIGVERSPGERVYHLQSALRNWNLRADGASAEHDESQRTLTVRAEPDRIARYELNLTFSDDSFVSEGLLIGVTWDVTVFMSPVADPRDDADEWRRFADRGRQFTSPHLHFDYGFGGPSQLLAASPEVWAVGFEIDHFGTLAATQVVFPEGTWRLRAVASDGIRVWMDDELVIDDWEGRPERLEQPATHTHEFTVDVARTIALRVEHFDIEGYATLIVEIEPAEQ